MTQQSSLGFKSAGALIAILGILFAVGIALSLTIENPLSFTDCLDLLLHPAKAESFDAYYYAYGTLPRLAAAIFGGVILGLVGCLLQQLTQNPMTSPLTLGTSSGGWLAIVVLSAFFPEAASEWLLAAAFAGALLAFGLIVLITGPRNMTGVILVISGMVVNLLFGAIATAVVLLHADFIQNVFLWGAGDLSQNGWSGLEWLLPRTLPVILLILLFAPRALALISLGDEGARARGFPVVPVFIALTALGVWLVAAFITTAGVINFTGLIAPNIARAAGFRSPGRQLLASILIGAALLTATDGAAIWLSALTGDIVPTGVVSAVVGTPIFIWIVRRQMSSLSAEASGTGKESLVSAGKTLSKSGVAVLAIALAGVLFLNLFLVSRGEGWTFGLAGDYELLLRSPRLVTALAAGAGLAAAGVILQRLIRNPLASPDILGVSAGASFAMVAGSLWFGASVGASGSLRALIGSLAVLAVLLLLSRRAHFAPGIIVLSGIALSAFLDSVTTLSLSRGTMENYFILQWLSGSTYRTTPEAAGLLALVVGLLIAAALAVSRSMTLLTVGRDFAQSRGLPLGMASLMLLGLCALLCAISTAAMGPVAFVGLVAPHMALMMGARTVKAQLFAAALLGGAIVSWADWLGQVLIYPAQIPAGTLAAILGAGYFLALLLGSRLRKRDVVH